mgnify:CR=1 FL=1
MSKKVYLSPSTQEHNIGSGNYGTEEARMNQIADITQKVLQDHGVDVYRNKPEWSLGQVVNDSNRVKPDLHFAIHSNAGGGRGSEVFAYAAGGDGEKAAKTIYLEIEPLTPTTDRGVKFNPSLYELRNTNAPAALVEIAFHDNAEDAAWIAGKMEAIGTALAKGVLKYFGIPYETSKEETNNSSKYYRVQIGAYSVKSNAENQLAKAKKAGFSDAYVVYY